MLIRDKVRLMTRLSIFEGSREGRKAFRICRFFRNDYLRWELIKTAISYTIGFIIVLGLAAMYDLENIVKKATSLDYKAVGGKMLVFYIIFLVIYLAFTYILSSVRYARHRKNYLKYDKGLRSLEKYYKETEDDAMEDDK